MEEDNIIGIVFLEIEVEATETQREIFEEEG